MRHVSSQEGKEPGENPEIGWRLYTVDIDYWKCKPRHQGGVERRESHVEWKYKHQASENCSKNHVEW